MKELQRLLGYQTLKAKYSRNFHIEEPVHDEDDTEITFKTTYKSPNVEKDEKIVMLEKEKEQLKEYAKRLQSELPHLQESLTKTKSRLNAIQKTVKQREKQINHATAITEKRLAEAVTLDPSYMKDNPHLVTLLAIFQERDDFDVDTENQIIKPVHEESFLKETVKNVMVLASKQENHSEQQEELCKDALDMSRTSF
jgi:septal ring factor EnvC (AmiA/AmiB activator)